MLDRQELNIIPSVFIQLDIHINGSFFNNSFTIKKSSFLNELNVAKELNLQKFINSKTTLIIF